MKDKLKVIKNAPSMDELYLCDFIAIDMKDRTYYVVKNKHTDKKGTISADEFNKILELSSRPLLIDNIIDYLISGKGE